MSKDGFDVDEIVRSILNPRNEWEEISEVREPAPKEIRASEIHISDKNNKKFVFPGNFIVRIEGGKVICSCE
jgi:hypothetical protein